MSGGEDNRSLAGLWNRARRFLPGGVRPDPGDQNGGTVHLSKTLRPFLQAMAEVSAPVVLDLGPVIGANVTFLGNEVSCKLYPVDLYASLDRPFQRGEGDDLATALTTKLGLGPGSVHGILAWDVFDYLGRDEAALLAKALSVLLRPGGVMMALATTEARDESTSRRYVIVDADHLRYKPAAGARWSRRVWPMRGIEVMLAPLEVVQSHLLAHHQREMLLRRPAGNGKAR